MTEKKRVLLMSDRELNEFELWRLEIYEVVRLSEVDPYLRDLISECEIYHKSGIETIARSVCRIASDYDLVVLPTVSPALLFAVGRVSSEFKDLEDKFYFFVYGRMLKKSSDGKYAAVSDFTDVSFKIL